MEAHHGQAGRGQKEVTCLTNPLKTPPKDTVDVPQLVQHPVGETKKQMKKKQVLRGGGWETMTSVQ